jgi:hypothetical protein
MVFFSPILNTLSERTIIEKNSNKAGLPPPLSSSHSHQPFHILPLFHLVGLLLKYDLFSISEYMYQVIVTSVGIYFHFYDLIWGLAG